MKKLIILSIIIFTTSSLAFGKTVTTGRGFGFKDYVSVQVTREGEKIQAIQVTDHKDTDKYADPAFTILIEDIIEAQSIEVDDFAGATGSSMGLKLAVEDALNN